MPETLEWGREGWKGGRTKRELRPRAEKGKVICGSDLQEVVVVRRVGIIRVA